MFISIEIVLLYYTVCCIFLWCCVCVCVCVCVFADALGSQNLHSKNE